MVAVFGNNWQEGHLGEVAEFFAALSREGVEAAVCRGFGEWLEAQGVSLCGARLCDGIPADASLVVSVGGDGTFLRAAEWLVRAAEWFGGRRVPVMGINTGHLGYLAGFSFDRMAEVLDAVARGRYDISRRMMLEVISPHLPEGFSPYALNEVSVSKGDTTSMVDVRAFVDGRFVADYLGDGLLAATPTGSTAYNLSCGGPIVAPTLEGIILTPVAPHSLTLRPMVIGADAEVRLRLSSRGEECHVGIDGRTFAVPSVGAELTLRRAPHTLHLAQPPGTTFGRVLRRKLSWGV